MIETQPLAPLDGVLRARENPACFVCGAANAHGLRIRFLTGGPGIVKAQWQPSPEWEGFQGILHGGVVSTVLDEAMSKAVASTQCEALTAELRVRFRKPAVPSEELSVTGWVRKKTKRRIDTEASVTGPDGSELAHAWATFLELRNPAAARRNGNAPKKP